MNPKIIINLIDIKDLPEGRFQKWSETLLAIPPGKALVIEKDTKNQLRSIMQIVRNKSRTDSKFSNYRSVIRELTIYIINQG